MATRFFPGCGSGFRRDLPPEGEAAPVWL